MNVAETPASRRGMPRRLAALYAAVLRRASPVAAIPGTPGVTAASDLEWVWATITDLDAARELEQRQRDAAH